MLASFTPESSPGHFTASLLHLLFYFIIYLTCTVLFGAFGLCDGAGLDALPFTSSRTTFRLSPPPLAVSACSLRSPEDGAEGRRFSSPGSCSSSLLLSAPHPVALSLPPVPLASSSV